MNTTTAINGQTPGPLTAERADVGPAWEVHAYGSGRYLAAAEPCPAPTVGPDEAPANARLLAAAYTLLDRAGRDLGIDAAELAERLDLAALIEAAQYAAELIKIARHRFPKSIRNHDTFQLNLAAATLSKALHPIPARANGHEATA